MSDNITGSQFNNFYNICHLFFIVRKRSCGKVMFLHLSVSHSVHREGGELAWQRRHAWQGQYVWEACVWGACMGACMAGACVAGGMCGRGHVWQRACVAGEHMCKGSICGRGRRDMHGRDMHGGGACMAGGTHHRGCMHGRRQERRPLQRTVRIILECILVYKKYSQSPYMFSIGTMFSYQRV